MMLSDARKQFMAYPSLVSKRASAAAIGKSAADNCILLLRDYLPSEGHDHSNRVLHIYWSSIEI